jgi:hypothetical protein
MLHALSFGSRRKHLGLLTLCCALTTLSASLAAASTAPTATAPAFTAALTSTFTLAAFGTFAWVCGVTLNIGLAVVYRHGVRE